MKRYLLLKDDMLHISDVNVTSSTTLEVSFTSPLSSQLTPDNVILTSSFDQIPNPIVLSISIQQNILLVTCQPLTPIASYTVTAISTDSSIFESVNGERVNEDGINNVFAFVTPLQVDNIMKSSLLSYFKGNVYDVENSTTLVSKYVDALSVQLSKALYDIRQLKNENYLTTKITDEQKIRGDGPFDRLDEEAAYEILRVGKTPEGFKATSTLTRNFTSSPVTLQQVDNTETFYPSSTGKPGFFQINDLVLTTSHFFVTEVLSITINQTTINPVFIYDVAHYGVQLLDGRYDQNASSYLLLENNQIKLSSQLLQNPLFSLQDVINVVVSYRYKDKGIFVDETSVTVATVTPKNREVLPPISSIFQLSHFPIVTSNNTISENQGVTFSNSNNPNTPHPAFLYELPFRLNALPQMFGQYSIDYENGMVYVYGALERDGSGPTPPTVTYLYRHTYLPDLDYTYDSDLLDLVSLPNGSLRSYVGLIQFAYEKVLSPNIDYVANVHVEELQERIENRLVATNALLVKNTPITNVFRIYNETSGEIYKVSRWNNNKVYFSSIQSPTVSQTFGEQVAFQFVPSELLTIHAEFNNSLGNRVLVLYLMNNSISASSDDFVGDSFNSSVSFSSSLFKQEKWFDPDITSNNDLLTEGMYTIDYRHGIVSICVSSTQDNNLGTIHYKTTNIVPQFPHLIAVDSFYNKINVSDSPTLLDYVSFKDGQIVPETLHSSAQCYLNDVAGSPYQVQSNKVGAFVDATFVTTLAPFKSLRSLYLYNDVVNNVTPVNFASYCTTTENTITISPIQETFSTSLFYDGTYYVLLPLSLFYKSTQFTFSFSVIRNSDSVELWNGSGTVVLGNQVRLTLPGVNSPQANQVVTVSYSITINNLSRIVFDVDKGNLYVDYTYLADEIVVSYEYGENQLDFRASNALTPGDSYYVSYKAGALRDTLLSNFGSLLNIDELSNFSTDLERERYRDAVRAGLSSFLVGPTISSLKNIGKLISHNEPELTESQFDGWSLGSSLLSPIPPVLTGNIDLVPAKYGFGPQMDHGQTLTLPSASNIDWKQGTFETWLIPNWDGIESTCDITFSIQRNYVSPSPLFIFLGEKETHLNSSLLNVSPLPPFTLTPSQALGIPQKTKDGIFIYYTDQWHVDILDGYTSPGTIPYQITITSPGTLTNVSKNNADSNITSSPNKIVLRTTNNTLNTGISFTADDKRYLLDVGEKTHDRFSLYKDAQGYFVLSVLDQKGKEYSISANVSNWKKGEAHYVAASWKLNSGEDELHLFLDGLEVPNVIRYVSATPLPAQAFRTTNSEHLFYISGHDIVGSNDLVTTLNSAIISSSLNFSSFALSPGDIVLIDEEGFDSNGYSIVSVSGQTITLSSVMPFSITGGNFSINAQTYTTSSEISLTKPIVSVLSYYLAGSITTNGSNVVSSGSFTSNVVPGDLLRNANNFYTVTSVALPNVTLSTIFPTTGTTSYYLYHEEKELHGPKAVRPEYQLLPHNQLKILNGVRVQDVITVKTAGLAYKEKTESCYVWGTKENHLLLSESPLSLETTSVKKIILPLVPIGPANSTYTTVFTSNNLAKDQPTTSSTGRRMEVFLSGLNIDFSTSATVTIAGTNLSGSVSQTLTFPDLTSQITTTKFQTITSIVVVMKPVVSTKAAGNVLIKEALFVKHSEGNVPHATLRFSYPLGTGYHLTSTSSTIVSDTNLVPSQDDVGNVMQISYPLNAAGFYPIASVTPAHFVLGTSLPVSVTNGIFKIWKTTDQVSPLTNGKLTFETDGYAGTYSANVPYYLTPGFYEVNYFTKLSITSNPGPVIYLGSSQNGGSIKGVLDQTRISGDLLTDTRVGETTSPSITTHYLSNKPIVSNSSTYLSLDYNVFPFVNEAPTYASVYDSSLLLSSSVNDKFGRSVEIQEAIVLPNNGLLDSKKEGTVEFWANPKVDTYLDGTIQTFFEATAAITETLVSSTTTLIELPQNASKVLHISVDGVSYTDGAKIEISRNQATSELVTPNDLTSVTVAKQIFQIVSVTIQGDLSGTNYGEGATISQDQKTIYLSKMLPTLQNLVVLYRAFDVTNQKANSSLVHLKKSLPYANTKVIVTYLPSGISGDSISLVKDQYGYLNFTIMASATEHLVRTPLFWKANTWHRVKASYKINQGSSLDEMRLFVDGYHFTNNLSGSGIAGNFPEQAGVGIPGQITLPRTIVYKDPIHEVKIGGSATNHFHGKMDNVRLSNKSREIFAPYGEPYDVSYSAYPEPVVEDLYTTYLLDVDGDKEKVTNFATINNKKNGSFDFSMTIFDSLDIINDSPRVKAILEKMLKVLKPANSKLLLSYKS